MSFLVTSVISGILVAAGGMRYVLMLAVGVLVLVEVYLALVHVPEPRIADEAPAPGRERRHRRAASTSAAPCGSCGACPGCSR